MPKEPGQQRSESQRQRADAERRHYPAAWRIAALGTALESLGLAVTAGLSAYGVLAKSASTSSRAVTEAIMLLVLAVGVAILSRNLFQRKSLAKTPTLVWNFMLVPVGYSLATGGAPTWGVIVIVLAAITFLAAVVLPRYDLEADETVL